VLCSHPLTKHQGSVDGNNGNPCNGTERRPGWEKPLGELPLTRKRQRHSDVSNVYCVYSGKLVLSRCTPKPPPRDAGGTSKIPRHLPEVAVSTAGIGRGFKLAPDPVSVCRARWTWWTASRPLSRPNPGNADEEVHNLCPGMMDGARLQLNVRADGQTTVSDLRHSCRDDLRTPTQSP
jgi:hypothetical protein